MIRVKKHLIRAHLIRASIRYTYSSHEKPIPDERKLLLVQGLDILAYSLANIFVTVFSSPMGI